MKKILFPLLQSNKGGNVLSTISICNNLNKKKFKTTVLFICHNKQIEKLSLKINKNINIDYLYLESKNKLIFFFKFYLTIYKYFLKKKIDIVHTNDGLLNFYFSFICIFFQKKHIIHLRNTDNSKRNFLSFLYAKKIICISKFVKNKTPKIFNKKKIILYNYVEFFNKKINIDNKHQYIFKNYRNKNFLLFISNIHKRKNPNSFIDLIKNLNKKSPDYFGLMFFQSNNSQLKSLKKYIKINKIEKKIFLFNNYPLHYWVPFVKKINKKILFAPSENEPLGRNLIEAILKKIFVVANNSGGHKEIIDKSNGILLKNIYSKKSHKLIHYIFLKYQKYKPKIVFKKFKNVFQDKNYIKKIEKIYLN